MLIIVMEVFFMFYYMFKSVAEVSPASIHRKDSYRKAQEQKLFLESNCVINKQNRYGPGRKVRTLINQNSLSQNMFENLNNNHTKIVNCNFPGKAFSNLEVKFTCFKFFKFS